MGRTSGIFCSQGYKGCVSLPDQTAANIPPVAKHAIGLTDEKQGVTCQSRNGSYKDITAQMPADFKVAPGMKFFWKGDHC